MRNPQGYLIVYEAEGPNKEADTITCAHCNSIVIMKARVDPSDLGGFCRLCMKHICGPCVDRNECIPYELKMHIVEEAYRKFKQLVDITRL